MEGYRACQTVTVARPGSMDRPSKTHRCGKRHTSAVNGGSNVITHTSLLTPSWVPREERHCTDTYSVCTVSGHHPGRHLHCTDVVREQLPVSRACCACSVPSTPPSSGRVIYDKDENIAETSEKNVQSEHTIYTMHTQGVTLEFCNEQHVPHLSWSLFSERPQICTP